MELLYSIQYRTGLRELHLDSPEDHLLVPHLLQLLQGQCYVVVESLYIGPDSSITSQQLSELVSRCPQLNTMYGVFSKCVSDAVLVELARSCPHLQKVALYSNELTEEGVLALVAYCRQLREIIVQYTTLTEETVKQLVQHCPRLTTLIMNLYVKVGDLMVGRYKRYSGKEIRALRNLVRQSDRESSRNAYCLVL